MLLFIRQESAMNDAYRNYRVAADGRHPFLDANGAFIGIGVPLLTQDTNGHWHPRPRVELERLFHIGFGERVELGWRMAKLASVARALNAGDRSMASIALVQMNLPPLPDHAAALLMARADGLNKNFNPDEPRDDHGRWTTEGGTEVAEADAGTKTDANTGSAARRLTYDQAKALVHDNNLSGLPDEVILAIMYKESSFDPSAMSSDPNSSAMGLMGITRSALNDVESNPKFAAQIGVGPIDLSDPATNVRVGSAYLELLISRDGGSLGQALATYGDGTEGYVPQIIAATRALIANPQNPEPTLEVILHGRLPSTRRKR